MCILYDACFTKTIIFICFRITAYTEPGVPLDELSCLIVPTESIGDKFRPPVNCHECMHVQGVKRLRNLSPVS